MRAILIDARSQTLTEIDIPFGRGSLRAMQTAVGGFIETAYPFANGDVIYVDEEGQLKGYEHWFTVAGAYQPFAGNGILCGHDDLGETVAAKLSLADLRMRIGWLDADQAADLLMD